MALMQEIVAELRLQILNGTLKPGDALPSVRAYSHQKGCAPGTVQRAYQELAQQGLVTARVGQGTRVTTQDETHTPLRRATLVNQLEAHLLGLFASGYSSHEIDDAFHEVLGRWHDYLDEPQALPRHVIRYVGSHDPSISLIAHHFKSLVPGYVLKTTYAGSLSGLIALARFGADIAGCHLWDATTDTYNVPFIRQYLPGRRVGLLTLAHRRLGLIVSRGNPHQITRLTDLTRPGVHFINRQWGTGTRLWLDAKLPEVNIAAEQIAGYDREVATHLEVAGAIAGGKADVGLGVEAAALAYGLDFQQLTTERYDLVIPVEVWELPEIQMLVRWLETDHARTMIDQLGGYDTEQTGHIEWVS